MNEKKPLIIASAVLALIIMAGGGTLYYLHFVVLPENVKARDAARKAVADAKDKKGKIKGFTETIESLKKEEEQKKSRIPNLDSKEYDGLAVLMDDLRKRAGVDINRGAFSQSKAAAAAAAKGAPKGGPAPPSANVHKVQYDFQVKGAFHQLVRYLNLVEKERRFLNVENFSIVRGSEAATKGKSAAQAMRELKISISSYTYRVPPTVEPPPTTPVADDKGGQSTPVPD